MTLAHAFITELMQTSSCMHIREWAIVWSMVWTQLLSSTCTCSCPLHAIANNL